MKANASGSIPLNTSKPVQVRQHRRGTYMKVRDERKRPIRGLWSRNGRYYAQITVEDPHTGVKQTEGIPSVEFWINLINAPVEAENNLIPARVRTAMICPPREKPRRSRAPSGENATFIAAGKFVNFWISSGDTASPHRMVGATNNSIECRKSFIFIIKFDAAGCSPYRHSNAPR